LKWLLFCGKLSVALTFVVLPVGVTIDTGLPESFKNAANLMFDGVKDVPGAAVALTVLFPPLKVTPTGFTTAVKAGTPVTTCIERARGLFTRTVILVTTFWLPVCWLL
jgi:hypothetical protein